MPKSYRVRTTNLLVSLICLVLASALSPALGQSRCEVPNSTCPQTTFGWMLFQDGNRGVPDFWFLETIEIDEISVCLHGIHFVFDVDEQGNRHSAALTFPHPTRALIEDRLGLDPDLPRGQDRLLHYQTRYLELRSSLERITGHDLGTGRQFDFRKQDLTERPRLLHSNRSLYLHWYGRRVLIRGYLDVYLILSV